MKLRVTTFNCENLFGRYRFLDKPPEQQPDYIRDLQIYDVIAYEPGRSNKLRPRPIAEAQRRNTAATILAARPDVLAVCEVENLATLRLFNASYLRNQFDRLMLVEGNDPRGIDVGLLLRKGLAAEVRAIRSHADDAAAGGYLPTTNMLSMAGRLGKASFSRDCLEVDVDIAGQPLTFLVNHFKAQETRAGRDSTTAKRRGQAERAALIARRARAAGRLPIVLGDFNKDIAAPDYDQSVDTLAASSTLLDPVRLSVPAEERWTHFFDSRRSVSRLDYVLVDQALTNAVTEVAIFRGGLSTKCSQYAGPRVGTIAQDDLEASDHCPLTVQFEL